MTLPEAIERLRGLNTPVPRPPRLATGAEVTAAESALSIQFPDDYRYFLLHGSDVVYGTLEPAVVTPDAGHLSLVEVAQNAWTAGVPKDLVPFCEDNGDYYCIRKDGRVMLWSHDGMFSGEWQDLAQWILDVWIGQ